MSGSEAERGGRLPRLGNNRVKGGMASKAKRALTTNDPM